jgi:hypothetical protein
MKLPKITTKQQEIVELLYRYRFLNRIQIQSFMGHTDKRRVLAWLKDLREKQYVMWIYSTDFTEKTKPAIYYLGLNGIRYLKTVQWTTEEGTTLPYYPAEELHKRYKEANRTKQFIDCSILVADCCLSLRTKRTAEQLGIAPSGAIPSYTYVTEADYIDPDSRYHFLAEHETLRPNLQFMKRNGKTVTKRYLLEIFDPHLPQYRLRNRIKAYVKYLTDDEWEGVDPQPTILLVLPTLYGLIYAKRKVRKLLLDEYYEAEDIPKDLHIRFTTTEQLQVQDITANIWEEGRNRLGV